MRRGPCTRRPNANEGRAALGSNRRPRLFPSPLDDPDDAMRDLLDGELADLDHRATEPALHLLGVVELLVDLDEARVLAVAAHPADALAADLREPLGVDRQPDDLRLIDREEVARWIDPLDERDIPRLVPEIPEVDRKRCLRRARDADEDDVRLVESR